MGKMHGVKIHREGTAVLVPLLGVMVALMVPLWLFMAPGPVPLVLTALMVTGYAFVFNFFRCPRRTYTGPRENHVVSSVDGKVVAIEKVYEGEFLHHDAMMVSVFMSPLNVHANWFPVDGRVKSVSHQDGNYHKAWLPKASEENERADIMITTPDGVDVLCRQIAGAMARRIVTYAKEGEECYIDEHLGFIKLGSRVDVFLPADSEVCVKLGQKTTGDLTVIAKLKPATAGKVS